MQEQSLKNCFLIATPNLKDSFFEKTVVYLFEHSEAGAMGLIINKSLRVNLGRILDHLKITKAQEDVINKPILMGGPVGQEHGFVLHDSSESDSEDSIKVTASTETLREIAKGKGPKHYLIMLGYCGWQPSQLENELARNDWLIAPCDFSVLFHTPQNKQWTEAAKLIGVDITHMSDLFGHA